MTYRLHVFGRRWPGWLKKWQKKKGGTLYAEVLSAQMRPQETGRSGKWDFPFVGLAVFLKIIIKKKGDKLCLKLKSNR